LTPRRAPGVERLRQAKAIDPEARTLLLDAAGFVTVAPTASLLSYRQGEGLLSPPAGKILHGITCRWSGGSLADWGSIEARVHGVARAVLGN
jgi:hypothetical protein